MNNTTRAIILLAVIACVMFIFTKRDDMVHDAAEQYETCVAEQYDMTPQMWYEVHGEYPPCESATQ